MPHCSSGPLLLARIIQQQQNTGKEKKEKRWERNRCAAFVRTFCPLSLPHANSSVCLSRSSPYQGEIIASYGDWMTDGRTDTSSFLYSSHFPLSPLSPLQTQLFRAIFFGLRFPQGGTARDVTRLLGVADWHQSRRRRSPRLSTRLPPTRNIIQ